jgi:Fungal specific transcription factor domain
MICRPSAPSDSGSQQSRSLGEWDSSQPLLTPADNDQPFPVVYFLDHRVFQHSRMQLPKTNWSVPSIIINFVGDRLALAQEYWAMVHWWMPIISKKRFYDQSLNPLVLQGVDVILLLSTMKLVLWHPGQAPRPVTEYMAIRHAILEAETAGILTLQLLQAKILLTIYEFGHAMYPAAYMSVGSCARYGTALGVNECLQTGLSISPESTLEIEEKKRSWWSILILDRFVYQVLNTSSAHHI